MYFTKRFFLPFIFSVLFFSSCSVERRHYSKGYHIAWNKSVLENKTVSKKENATSSLPFPSPENGIDRGEQNLTASSSNVPQILLKIKEEPKISVKDSCDIILFKNDKQVYVTIIEMGEKTIKYKMCNPKSDSVITVNSSSVSMIKHTDGRVERIIEKPDDSSRPLTANEGHEVMRTKKMINTTYILMIVSLPLLLFGVGIITLFIAFFLGLGVKQRMKRNYDKYTVIEKRRIKSSILVGGILSGIFLLGLLFGLVYGNS